MAKPAQKTKPRRYSGWSSRIRAHNRKSKQKRNSHKNFWGRGSRFVNPTEMARVHLKYIFPVLPNLFIRKAKPIRYDGIWSLGGKDGWFGNRKNEWEKRIGLYSLMTILSCYDLNKIWEISGASNDIGEYYSTGVVETDDYKTACLVALRLCGVSIQFKNYLSEPVLVSNAEEVFEFLQTVKHTFVFTNFSVNVIPPERYPVTKLLFSNDNDAIMFKLKFNPTEHIAV